MKCKFLWHDSLSAVSKTQWGHNGEGTKTKSFIFSIVKSEELKQVPAKLEILVREKHFLAAVTLLVSSSKTISKPEMASVGALSDLSRFFNEQLEVRIDGFHKGVQGTELCFSGRATDADYILMGSCLVHGRDPYGGTS